MSVHVISLVGHVLINVKGAEGSEITLCDWILLRFPYVIYTGKNNTIFNETSGVEKIISGQKNGITIC